MRGRDDMSSRPSHKERGRERETIEITHWRVMHTLTHTLILLTDLIVSVIHCDKGGERGEGREGKDKVQVMLMKDETVTSQRSQCTLWLPSGHQQVHSTISSQHSLFSRLHYFYSLSLSSFFPFSLSLSICINISRVNDSKQFAGKQVEEKRRNKSKKLMHI